MLILQGYVNLNRNYNKDIHHRHASHLFGLYPGREISPIKPECFAAARKFLKWERMYFADKSANKDKWSEDQFQKNTGGYETKFKTSKNKTYLLTAL
ncbi:hypothetical protein ASU31_23200 [Pedobacter ginsenosidimutans]|uniref:Glycosyl hydrolase family 95 catalytic domain-containing protein n=1 Tax=Pedobacter ginsenosidimutans TaxID=687842 RepID=A0A0T5VIJ4_9SPHI|nr:hypothetical protein [Pedobacter ginsenosidimutans]KRT13704.1 hypothetical protein ASU31_23200 [Pedobacter ginsenosidimutans]